MIRVLQIVTRMDRGGLESFIMNVYRGIDKNIIQFDFLTHSSKKGAYDDEIESLGGRIYRVRPRRESYFGNLQDLNDFFYDHHEYGIIHMHESSMSYVTPLIVAKKHGVKNRILHSRNNNITTGEAFKILHKVNRFRFKNLITEKYAISKEAAIWMFGQDAYDRGNVKILKNGIVPTQFIYCEEYRKKIREELNIGNEHIVLGNIGRLSKQKNQIFLLRIFEILFNVSKKYRLIIIGDGSEYNNLRAYVEANELDDFVILLKNRPDVNKYYSAFDCFVMPSLFEGFGRVLLEAQCNGLVCFASKGVIAEEVKILSSFQLLPLDVLEKWAIAIINSTLVRDKDAKNIVINSGYDIKNTTLFLQNRYIEMIEGSCT